MLALAICKRRRLPIITSASTLSLTPFENYRHYETSTRRKRSISHLRGERTILPRKEWPTTSRRRRFGDDFVPTSRKRRFGDDSKTRNTTLVDTTNSTTTTSRNKEYHQRNKNSLSKTFRRGVGAMMSISGLLTSTIKSTQTPTNGLKSLQKFLKESGVELEISQTLNRHLALNLTLCARIQKELWKSRWKKQNHKTSSSSSSSSLDTKFWQDAKRYVRYATAAYGQAMIYAAEMDARGNFEFERLGELTKDSISKHISIPSEDIQLLDVDYDGDIHHLRHFVAVDHENKKVILSIRGTFNLNEVVVDVTAFSREFCGGEAHSEMATMAERVWEKAGTTISSLLNDHPHYGLVVTGHSLGGGTACLLTSMILSKKLVRAPTKCFAFASPPVFFPVERASGLGVTTNFIHQQDVIPAMSMHSVRHLFGLLQTIQTYQRKNLSRTERLQVAFGLKAPPKDLVDAFREQQKTSMPPIEGSPRLEVPAAKTVRLHPTNNDHGSYTWECLSPQELIRHYEGIRIHPEMFLDHLAPRYEHALEHLDCQRKQK